MGDLLTSKGHKFSPQTVLSVSIRTCIPWRNTQLICACTEHQLPHLSHTSPFLTHKTTLLLYPINISSPSHLGSWVWDLFSDANLSILRVCFTAHQASETDSVTNFGSQPGDKSRWTFCAWVMASLLVLRACGGIQAAAWSISSKDHPGILPDKVLLTSDALFCFAAKN